MVLAKHNYSHVRAKNYVEALGMVWDQEFAERFDVIAHDNLELTQEEFDLLVREYAWRVKTLFDPENYPWKQRIAIVLHFLGIKLWQ